MPAVDRNRWIRERIKFLEDQLAGELSDDQRALMEMELATLREERTPPWKRFLGFRR